MTETGSERSVAVDRPLQAARLAPFLIAATLLVVGILGLHANRATAQSGDAVDLALILAIDCSYSVDRAEYELQLNGMSRAFRRQEIVDAIRNGTHARIAVAVVQWSDLAHQAIVVPWQIVSDEASAARLADAIAVTPRNLAEGGTSITAMMGFGAKMLSALPFKADRYVIDIAADGRNNNGGDPRPMRDVVIARGITINGLAILNEVETLDKYFQLYITGGPANFVEIANNYEAYSVAIFRKLLREIIGPQVS